MSSLIYKQCLTNQNKLQEQNKINKIEYDGLDSNGNIILKIPTNNIKETLKTVHKSIELEIFASKNLKKLQLLTKREKEVLKLISQEQKQQEIADKLFISLHMLRTHWKNIKTRL